MQAKTTTTEQAGNAATPETPDSAQSLQGTGRDGQVFSELLSKGAEEIQDHLSLVARIQVKIGQLLEASIDELERAQRLETLTSLIGGSGPEKDGPGQDQGSFSDSFMERPGVYLEREIKTLKKMQKLLGVGGRSEEGVTSPSPEASQAIILADEIAETDAVHRILVIYNDPGTVRVLRYFLEKENYEVLASTNGPDGLQKAVKEKPDLILLDILLPAMDGYQVLSRLKKSEKTARIPVFVLSVLAQEADILKAIENGASDYFTKPFSPHIIIAKIRRALKARHE